MDNNIFKKFIDASKKNNRILYDPDEFGEHEEILKNIYLDAAKFDAYTLNGQFQDILIDVVNNYTFKEHSNYYNDFLNEVYIKFKEIIVPIMILVPLNNIVLDFTNKDHVEITTNIRIYNPTNIDYNKLTKFHNKPLKKDSLSIYFENSIYAELCKEHIILVKDRYFFNNPIMTILINNIPFKVEHEAAKISEAVYSFIRMIDFDVTPEKNGWGVLDKLSRPSGMYGVYYNSPNTSKNPPFNSGYGHPFIFKFDPILDINTTEFANRLPKFESLLSTFIELCFINRINKDEKDLKIIDKWINAVLLYNSAYEMASKERYDITIITLLTILESLFLKNTGNKKELLSKEISEFLINKGFDYNEQKIKDLIKETYSHRSKFVHEGEVYYNLHTYKIIGDWQGTIPGMKPFSYSMFPCNSHDDARSIYMLFRITGYVIMSFFD